jgi:hypothetical protein
MRLVYEEWHKRIPDYRIAPGLTPRVTWPRGTIGLESLHLQFGGGDALPPGAGHHGSRVAHRARDSRWDRVLGPVL